MLPFMHFLQKSQDKNFKDADFSLSIVDWFLHMPFELNMVLNHI